MQLSSKTLGVRVYTKYSHEEYKDTEQSDCLNIFTFLGKTMHHK